MTGTKVYANFHNADRQGRVRFNCIGTLEDLARQQIRLRDGLRLTLYADNRDDRGRLDEWRVEGIVSYSQEEGCWVAAVDWSALRHVSDDRGHRRAG